MFLLLEAGGLKALAEGSSSVDRFVASRLMFEPVAPMAHSRSSHTATRLSNGNALVCGGVENGMGTASCEIFDQRAGLFRAGRSLGAPRWSHAALALSNGDVLISGGMSNDNRSASTTWGPSKSALIYRVRETGGKFP
jgi:hypothetical protein